MLPFVLVSGNLLSLYIIKSLDEKKLQENSDKFHLIYTSTDNFQEVHQYPKAGQSRYPTPSDSH